MMGASLARLWGRAGHEVRLSSRHPEDLRAKVDTMEGAVEIASVAEAIEASEVIVLAVPFVAIVEIAETYGAAFQGKVVLDPSNPFHQRDGDLAHRVKHSGQGSGAFVGERLPGARLVKAFNTVFWKTLNFEAHRDGERVGVPLASDDEGALEVAERLVRDAGFEPVRIGGLADAIRLDPGSKVWNSGFTAAEIRAALGLDEPE